MVRVLDDEKVPYGPLVGGCLRLSEGAVYAIRSEAPEISLASEAGPLSEDRQDDDLGVGKQGRTTDSRRFRRVLELPPVVQVINEVDFSSEEASTRALTKRAYCDIEIESKDE